MKKPVLIIMAAGLGSRFGGLKQMTPVDSQGHLIIDYSIYDAHRAGFETVICVVAPHLEDDFREQIGKRVEPFVSIQYVHQKLENVPEGFCVPAGRTKPWGTAHAVLSAKEKVDAPFAVINADDFYGYDAFRTIYRFLESQADASHHAMVGYAVENTLTDHGYVSRGVCKTDNTGRLIEIIERTKIKKTPDGAAYTEDNEHFTLLPTGTVVSMNMWGFGKEMMDEISSRFSTFLKENLPNDPLKCEYFLPYIPNALLHENKAEISVLPTKDRWYGITYVQDMPIIKQALEQMKEQGKYPQYLWNK